MKSRFAALALAALPAIALPLPAMAADNQPLQTDAYVAAGGGYRGPVASVGWGTKVDALELNWIDLGTVGGTGSAKFAGVSLVQNSTPVSGFSWLFRIGLGRETTTFPGGISTHRMWFSNVFFGLGAQYEAMTHLAFRAEIDRIAYAASPDGVVTGMRYPATLSIMYTF